MILKQIASLYRAFDPPVEQRLLADRRLTSASPGASHRGSLTSPGIRLQIKELPVLLANEVHQLVALAAHQWS